MKKSILGCMNVTLLLLAMVLPYAVSAQQEGAATPAPTTPAPTTTTTAEPATPAPAAPAVVTPSVAETAPAPTPAVDTAPAPAGEAAPVAEAAPAPTADPGHTAWMLTATALVLFMTIPGLALFYAGMVRSKNVLSVMMQCFAITCVMTLLWIIYGYSFAFSDGGELNQWIGGAGDVLLADFKASDVKGVIPESVFLMFQMTFAIITPALIVGAFAERMKFSSMLVFMTGWFTLVYVPVCHWVWGGGWLGSMGVLDFAGGTVVHINAGIAGLICALVLGVRKGFPHTPMPPHNLTFTIIGASMLWVGWFGFNAGSELAADNVAGMAMLVTQVATATAALAWMFSEWITHGKPSVLGIVSGAVAGLVAITPASGTAGALGAIAIGAAAGVICFIASTRIKRALGYDDSLDVFGVHAVGGIVGAILTGVFADASMGGIGLAEGRTMIEQVNLQVIGVVATLVYTVIVTFILLQIINIIMGLRVDEESEQEGLDMSQHNERGYIL